MSALSAYLDNWNYVVVCLRLVLAVACGGGVGYSRSMKRRGAGFKTHALVCLGAALVMLTGEYIYHVFGTQFEIARLGAQVVSGVSFLGVGTIIITGKNHIQGLTTAAGLWTCACIGIALGIGFYTGAIVTTLLVLFIYRFMWRMDELAYARSRELDLYIEFENRRVVAGFVSTMKSYNYKITQMEMGKSKKNKDDVVNATVVVETAPGTNHHEVLALIHGIDGVLFVEELQ